MDNRPPSPLCPCPRRRTGPIALRRAVWGKTLLILDLLCYNVGSYRCSRLMLLSAADVTGTGEFCCPSACSRSTLRNNKNVRCKAKMKRTCMAILTALCLMATLLPVTALADSPDNGAARTTMTLAEFVKAVEQGQGTYDGKGVVVEITPASGCDRTSSNGHTEHTAKTENTPDRIQSYSGTSYAQYIRFADGANESTDISISNVTFKLVPPSDNILVCGAWNTSGTSVDKDALDAELQLTNKGSVTFTGCTFENVAVSPISASSVAFTDCDFSGLAGYAIKDVSANVVSVTESKFDDCSGGVYMNGGGTTSTTYTKNEFTNIGYRGAIQFAASGDYSTTAFSITGNTFTGKEGEDSGFLRQLNATISRDKITEVIADNTIPEGMGFTSDSSIANIVLPKECSFEGNNTIYDGTDYYETMKAALEGIHQKNRPTLWCKPGADVGLMTHGHVCADLTVYGNGAYISGNGEDDFEVDTYDAPGGQVGSDLTGNVTLKVYNLNGSGAWGERKSEYTVNLWFEGCQNMNRVYLTGTSGANNITLINCTFDGTQTDYKKASSCTLYSNAPGTITVEDCTFTSVKEPINLNNKAGADTAQAITVKNSTFTDCSTEDICNDDATWAAPIRIVSSEGADSEVSVDSCTFAYTSGKVSVNGDILLGDGRTGETSYPVSATLTNTAAQVQIHNPGDRTVNTNNGKTISVTSSDQPASISNVVATIGTQGYTSLDAAITAARSMADEVTIELIADANLTANFAAALSNNISYDLSTSSLTSLTIRGASQDVKIISGVDGNDIDAGDRPYCPKINVTLPANAAFTVENLTFPNDLQFDSNGGTVVIQNCVFNGSISGYPQAKSISYLNNTFEFKGTASNFYSGNAYPVWYKSTGDLDFTFNGNTVIGCRGVHIETRSNETSGYHVDIEVNNNHFTLKDDQNPTKTVALQLVRYLNGNISFQNNYVDAYMAICFYSGLAVEDDASLTVKNNYLVDDCKLYGSNEWSSNEETADAFAKTIIDKLTGEGGASTVTPGHTEHNYVDGVCTICGQSEPTSSTSYAITVESSDNGTVTASRTSANKGLTVTLTVKADEGYVLDTLTVTDKNGNEVKLTDKGDGKYTFSMPASAVTVKASFAKDDTPVETGLPFTDVKADDWFYEAVKYAYDNKLMDGTSSTTFAPLMTTNRAMIVTILWRQEGSPVVNYAMNFSDVESGVWYTEAVRWAAAEGIVKGYSDTVFAPDDTVTREQLATILYRYAEYKEYDVSAKGDLTTFADGSTVSTWAADGMTWAVGAELITGKDGGKLDPTGTATRAEVATILMRFCENVAK